ncbi:myb-like protein X [Cydia splendana]|uniref:myb-like protein X n=1 Tax=Cydia splendana TaxID=1100963 RepID=UPI00300C0CFA
MSETSKTSPIKEIRLTRARANKNQDTEDDAPQTQNIRNTQTDKENMNDKDRQHGEDLSLSREEPRDPSQQTLEINQDIQKIPTPNHDEDIEKSQTQNRENDKETRENTQPEGATRETEQTINKEKNETDKEPGKENESDVAKITTRKGNKETSLHNKKIITTTSNEETTSEIIGLDDSMEHTQGYDLTTTRLVNIVNAQSALIQSHLTLNRSVKKESKEAISESVKKIQKEVERYALELTLTGKITRNNDPQTTAITTTITSPSNKNRNQAVQTDEYTPTTAPQPKTPVDKLKEDIINGVKTEIEKLIYEQKAVNELVVAALTRPIDDEEKEIATTTTAKTVENNNNKNTKRGERTDTHRQINKERTKEKPREETTITQKRNKQTPINENNTNQTHRKVTKINNNNNNKTETSYAVILENIDPRKENAETLKQVQDKVDVIQLGVGIQQIRYTKSNKVVINCENEEDREKLSTAIRNNNTGVTVEVPKLRNPQIKLIGVINENVGDKITEAIHRQNPNITSNLSGNEKLIKYIRHINRRDSYTKNVIIEVSPEIYNRIQQQRKIRIGYQSVMAVEQQQLLQCYNCMGYNHRASICTAKTRCGYCAETHDTRKCPNRYSKDPNCSNCQKKGMEHIHAAYSLDCPEYSKWSKIAKMSIRYR